MSTAMDLIEDAPGSSPGTTRPAPIRSMNALSKLADSDSEAETNARTRKVGGRLLSRLQVESEDSSESDEEASNRAAERAKQRLMLTKPIDILSSDDEDEGDDEGAYERMRKQLLAAPAKQQASNEPAQEQKNTARIITSSSEDEDDAPVQANRTRRLHLRRERTVSPPKSPSSSVLSRRSSPGLFVTPNASPAPKRTQHISPAEHNAQPIHNADFNERVERIRAERLAKQKQKREEQKRAKITRRDDAEDSDGRKSDGEDGRRLTQLTKPTRKAGKKALEAMAREQQRIERNMQLTHRSKTKKRYGTKDLFAKFGFPQGVENVDTVGLPTPDQSSLPASPDAEEGVKSNDTPPTSPPRFEDAQQKAEIMEGIETSNATASQDGNTSLPSAKLDKGKGRAPEFQHLPPNALLEQSRSVIVQRAEPVSKMPSTSMVDLSDSEDDLEVVKPKSRFPVFDKLPEKKNRDSSSLLHLRHLAGVRSPGKKQPQGGKSMNFAQLGASLHQKARQQAHQERQEKLEELRRKGIHVETEEEREQRQMEIEDMVAQFEKQRQEDLALAKFERKEAKANGETGDGLLSSDESEDDDYVASGEENAAEGEDEDNAEGADLELSGSEEEEALEDEGDDEEDDEDAVDKPTGLFDETADENEDADEEDMEDDTMEAPIRKRAVHRARHVVVDDEDEDEDAVLPNGSPTQAATQDNAMAAFGFGDAAPAVGLTQAFAGTMANMGSGSQDDDVLLPEQEQDSLDFLRSLPDTQPDALFSKDFLIPNSQTATSQQIESQDGPVSQLNLGISQLVDTSPAFSRTQLFNTQLSEVPEPTQDAGFLMSRSPAGVHAPISTVDTLVMGVAESPTVQRKGKLRRGRQATPVELSDIDVENVFSGSDVDEENRTTKAKDVFSVMKKAAKKQKKVDNFDKKTSWARDAIEEQAEESEDEYAGIGGASDDDSDEADEELAKMIDTSDVKVDERQLAAFFA
jgi:mediator of replication checkpoint protein 1